MARITWQNVAAPDARAAIAGVGQAGELFASAASQFGGTMKDVAGRQRRDASKEALDAALGFGDAASWDTAMQTQGIGALGIRPEQATGELMDFVMGRGKDLRAEEAAALAAERSAANSAFSLNRDQYDFDRAKLEDQRADETLEESEAAKAARLEALGISQGIADETFSREEAERRITASVEDPTQQKLLLDALEEVPANQWTADENFTGTALLNEQFGLVGDSLSALDSGLTLEQSTNPGLSFYAASVKAADGFENPMLGMIDRLNSRIDPNEEDSEGMIARSSGQLAGVYENIAKEYPNLPASMIATAIENNLQNTGLGWLGDNGLKPAMGGIRAMLDAVNTPEQIAQLEQERVGIERRIGENREVRESFDSVIEKFELASSRGNQGQVDSALKDLEALRTMVQAKTKEAGGTDAEAQAAADQLIADVQKSLGYDAQEAGAGEANSGANLDQLFRDMSSNNRLNGVGSLGESVGLETPVSEIMDRMFKSSLTPQSNGIRLEDMSVSQKQEFSGMTPEQKELLFSNGVLSR